MCIRDRLISRGRGNVDPALMKLEEGNKLARKKAAEDKKNAEKLWTLFRDLTGGKGFKFTKVK